MMMYISCFKQTNKQNQELIVHSKYAVLELGIALTTFRQELNMSILTLFVMLLFIKMFHWLANMRVDNV